MIKIDFSSVIAFLSEFKHDIYHVVEWIYSPILSWRNKRRTVRFLQRLTTSQKTILLKAFLIRETREARIDQFFYQGPLEELIENKVIHRTRYSRHFGLPIWIFDYLNNHKEIFDDLIPCSACAGMGGHSFAGRYRICSVCEGSGCVSKPIECNHEWEFMWLSDDIEGFRCIKCEEERIELD